MSYMIAGDKKNKYIHFQDKKPSGVFGGDFNSGAPQKRLINTLIHNTIAGASVNSAYNSVVLPKGRYFADISAATCQVDFNTLTIKVGNDVILSGVSNLSGSHLLNNFATLRGFFTLDDGANVLIYHQCSATRSTYGLGKRLNFAGVSEVFLDGIIRKVT